MSTDITGSAAPPSNGPGKPGLLEKIRRWLIATETEFSFVKGLTFLGFAGTLIAAYFQYLSDYQAKVATQAKEDLAAATSAFTETSNALSIPITLQAALFYDFVRATKPNGDSDANGLPSKNAADMYNAYENANAALRQNINVFARKVEIYLDWPSDPKRDRAVLPALNSDPISTSALGAHDFDCDNAMPKFEKGQSRLPVTAKDGGVLEVDWFSAKHHVLTIGYCFYVTHEGYMEVIRQWASHSSFSSNDAAKFVEEKKNEVQVRMDRQVMRLNAFMTLAMDQIDRIRAKYEPNGFVCHVPIVSEGIWLISRKCRPV